MRILLIDDDEIILDFVRLCIEDAFQDVEFVDYNSERLGKPGPDFDWTGFDALLLDYNLGNGQTGVEWLNEFGQIPGFPRTILITSVEDPYVVADAIKAGADNYLNKADLTPERLELAVRDVLTARHVEETMPEPRKARSGDTHELIENFEREAASRRAGGRSSYRFGRQIGRGAMSTVYIAERNEDGATVVLKILDRSLATDEGALQRFILEGRLISELDSPYVVKIFEQGFTNSYGYIAMEFFGRGDLKQRISQGISIRDSVAYLDNIACGLQAIHSVGIVHRDLKPANIMFRSDGSLALADFGVSKRLGVDMELTNAGTIVGTPHYLSPEQAQGLPADPRSDLYGAGAIFHEMLTGSPPYRGDTISAIIFSHLHADLPTLSGDHAHLQPLLHRLLAKRPGDRFQSAAELRQALREYAG